MFILYCIYTNRENTGPQFLSYWSSQSFRHGLTSGSPGELIISIGFDLIIGVPAARLVSKPDHSLPKQHSN